VDISRSAYLLSSIRHIFVKEGHLTDKQIVRLADALRTQDPVQW
jgi:hypothetical protein